MKALVAVLLFGLTSCGAMQTWARDTAVEIWERERPGLLASAKDLVAVEMAKRAPPELKAKADTDNSGDVSWSEWTTLLQTLGPAGIAYWLLRNRLKGKVTELWASLTELKEQPAKATAVT